MKFDLTKPLQTKSGLSVRILCTDAKGPQPLVGVVLHEDGTETAESWGPLGTYYRGMEPASWDLENVPEKKVVTGWLNVYRRVFASDGSFDFCFHPTKKGSDTNARGQRIACVPITFEVGGGQV